MKRVRAIIVNEKGEILFGISPGGEYRLPGGKMLGGEHPVDALKREVFEETGISEFVTADYLFDLHDNHVFLISPKLPPFTPNSENDPDSEFESFEWVAPNMVPDNVNEYAEDILFKFFKDSVSEKDVAVDFLSPVIGEIGLGYWKRLAEDTLQDLLSEYCSEVISPKVEIVENSDWLAKTKCKEFPDENVITVSVNSSVCTNPDLLRQVLAHEMIHCYLYSKYGVSKDQHGDEFSKMAEMINLKEGENYITPYADNTDFVSY